MRHADFDCVTPQPSFDTLPVAFVESSSQPSLIAKAIVLGPACLLVAAPLAMLGLGVVASPADTKPLAISPVTLIQLFAAFVVWTGLFIVPFGRILSRLGRRRAVRIEGSTVHLATHGPFGVRHATQPLRAYEGVVHRVHTTLSGARHEMVLMHADPSLSVLLAVADRISEATVERAAMQLGLPVISGRTWQLPAWKLPIFARRPRGLTEAQAT
jgi:hypothetical protein